MTIELHTTTTAPAAARTTLSEVEAAYGFLPNLFGVMAGAPALARAYRAAAQAFDETSLSPTERQVVLLAVSAENGCDYCMAAHCMIGAMQGVDEPVLAAVRARRAIGDARLEALHAYTVEVVRTRGWPGRDVTAAFAAAGYGPAQMLEVVLGVGVKTLSNYTNHIAETPIDAAFGVTPAQRADAPAA